MRAVFAVVVGALLIAGCGGDTKSKNDYVDKVNRAQSDFVAVVDDSESRITGNASDKDTATQLDMIRAAAAKVVVELKAIKPPGEAKTLHGNLIREAEGLVAAFRKAADAYESGRPAQILSAKVDLSKDVTKVNAQLNATIQALNEKLRG
jgi:outer membrane murein-binding lipoprotein Lpp